MRQRSSHPILFFSVVFFLFAAYSMPPQRMRAQDNAADSADGYLDRGKQELAANKYQDALKAFEKANSLRHNNCAECYLAIASARARLGSSEDALKDCDKAIALATDDPLRAAGHQLKGNILFSTAQGPKQFKAAESEMRAGLQLDGRNPRLHLDLGITLLKEEEDTEGSSEINTYLHLAPNGEEAAYARKLLVNPRRAGDELAPEFKIHTLQGETLSLSQFSGKILVLDFWATWCPPCVSSVPELKKLTKTYSSDQLVLISMSADQDEAKWREFVDKRSMDWAQYWDQEGEIRKAFGVHAFPTYLVIDQQGFIRHRIVGLNPQQTIVFRLRDTLKAMLEPNGAG